MAQQLEVTIPAAPEPVTLDLGRTAVLVVDMQNDFGAEGGMFHRAGIDITPIQAVVAPTARLLGAARAAGVPVIYLKMEFRPDLSDAGAPDTPNRRKHAPLRLGELVLTPDEQEGRILVRETWNTAILDALAPQPSDIVVAKHRYSGFYQTDLDLILKTLGAQTLLVTGCTTSICVDSTIRDAMYRDYTCVLLADCTAEPLGYGLARSNHDASLLTIQALFGWVANSDDVIAALQTTAAPAAPAYPA